MNERRVGTAIERRQALVEKLLPKAIKDGKFSEPDIVRLQSKIISVFPNGECTTYDDVGELVMLDDAPPALAALRGIETPERHDVRADVRMKGNEKFRHSYYGTRHETRGVYENTGRTIPDHLKVSSDEEAQAVEGFKKEAREKALSDLGESTE